MRIVTWNVNSLKARQAFVEAYLDAEAPDVLCIQELKLETDKVPTEIFSDRGYTVAVHGQKQWNGVLIASKFGLEDVQIGLDDAEEGQSRLIAATTGGVRVVNLYCPQGQRADSEKFQYKLRFYDALLRWFPGQLLAGRPTVLLGDLNVAREVRDIYSEERLAGEPSFHPAEHERWDALLDLGLVDVCKPWMNPGTYTFWDYRGGAWNRDLGMRIDHFLGDAAFAGRCREARVLRQWRKDRDDVKASDHAPVEVTLYSEGLTG